MNYPTLNRVTSKLQNIQRTKLKLPHKYIITSSKLNELKEIAYDKMLKHLSENLEEREFELNECIKSEERLDIKHEYAKYSQIICDKEIQNIRYELNLIKELNKKMYIISEDDAYKLGLIMKIYDTKSNNSLEDRIVVQGSTINYKRILDYLERG